MTVRKAVPKSQPKPQVTPNAKPQPQELPQTSTPTPAKPPTLNELNIQQRKLRANHPQAQPLTTKVQVQHKPLSPPPIQKGNT